MSERNDASITPGKGVRPARIAIDVPVQRPRPQPPRHVLSADQREALAGRVNYVGSPEHKDHAWWGGRPQGRWRSGRPPRRPKKQLTTICPLVSNADRATATRMLRAAVAAGQYEFVDGDEDFPKRVWYSEMGQGWQAYCINRTTGEYKGWPVDEDELRAFRD